ncbi:symporter [Mangrovimonas yunxiaonensis]|uniref:Symporter n=1 Tax=Mangrovimonas yunxiaonensis TaxID=1197477 RepID=A0A084TJ83_9FLAO|nr:bile acid:sodium symporter family protein [Mangrovimonas yunxiaonensis]KFB00769.1 symporter [Mangrovimonas yunxiaonensis]GGH45819.1 symporter [Mangrovimonas yunxiaonensis]
MQELDLVKLNFSTQGLWVLNIALAIVMFGVALGITLDDFKRLIKLPRLLFLGLLSQFVLLPLVTFAFVWATNPQPSIALGMFMVAACPGGNISNFMTHLAKGNTALSVSLTAFTTLMAIVMTPFNFQLYSSLHQPTAGLLRDVALSPVEVLKVVGMVLGLPLILGMLVRYRFPERGIKLSKGLKPFSIVVFVAIVCIAFSKNFDVFTGYVDRVLVLGIGHNILALFLGWCLAKSFGVSLMDRKAITLETGIQNSGLGLLLIFTFFDGLGGMAIMAAFWGIWHVVSGLVLAYVWSFKTTTH